jgi:hypothetical protein
MVGAVGRPMMADGSYVEAACPAEGAQDRARRHLWGSRRDHRSARAARPNGTGAAGCRAAVGDLATASQGELSDRL